MKLPLLFKYKEYTVHLLPNKEFLIYDGQDYETVNCFESVITFINNALNGKLIYEDNYYDFD